MCKHPASVNVIYKPHSSCCFHHAGSPGSEYPNVEIYIDTTIYLAPESNPDVPCPVRLSAPYPQPIPVCIELVPLDGGTCV